MTTPKSKYLIAYILILCTAVIGAPARHSLQPSSCPLAEFRFVDEQFGKPPLIRFYFDAVLCNKSSKPKWFLLPSNLGPDRKTIRTAGGVDAIEVFRPRGVGRVVIGRFLGNAGFQALLLRPGARVQLRRLQISYWGERPDQLQAEVIVAKSLKIGGEDASRWFGIESRSRSKVDITENATDTMRMVHSRRTPDNREVPVEIGESESLTLQIDLKK